MSTRKSADYVVKSKLPPHPDSEGALRSLKPIWKTNPESFKSLFSLFLFATLG